MQPSDPNWMTDALVGDLRTIAWQTRATGFGVRSWRIEVSRQHIFREGESLTLCGVVMPRRSKRTAMHTGSCRKCDRRAGVPTRPERF